jgi:arginine/ornithine transport system permease protein
MNWEAIQSNLPLYWDGMWLTLQLLAGALILGLLGALPLSIARASTNPWISRPVWLYTYIMRGTPMLVQLFLIYYGLAQFDWVRESPAWPLLSQPWFCAVLAFALNTCAYTIEIIAGAMRATPPGEVEAARSLGMSRSQVYLRILLPSAFRRALPSYSNEAIFMLHGTSLASIVTLMDLTGVARDVNSRFFAPFEAFILAAAFYLVLTFAMVGLFHLAERRWLAYLRPRATPSH